ncbi:MAG: MOSC domain-containing protein [Gemmatimonadales bacterium]|nr:MOSC domain-containing protein [Gemmatimonadales bacterium]
MIASRITSIQAGQPVTTGIPGSRDPMNRPFTSAIWKEPIPGPVTVTRNGIEGDTVANHRHHGGRDQALLAYASTHYAVWRAEWGTHDLANGGFGENLTVDDADEHSVCIGDIWEAGPVRLEVTQPREPCATLARRHGRAELVRTLTANGRSGWYLRVLSGGTLSPGDVLTLSARPYPVWTIRRAALVRHGREGNQGDVEELAGLSALGHRFRAALVHRLHATQS